MSLSPWHAVDPSITQIILFHFLLLFLWGLLLTYFVDDNVYWFYYDEYLGKGNANQDSCLSAAYLLRTDRIYSTKLFAPS